MDIVKTTRMRGLGGFHKIITTWPLHVHIIIQGVNTLH